jgi:hypothetical protein
VTGIVPTLESSHDIGPARKPVDDLALPLVAPLAADDGDVCQSFGLPLKWTGRI